MPSLESELLQGFRSRDDTLSIDTFDFPLYRGTQLLPQVNTAQDKKSDICDSTRENFTFTHFLWPSQMYTSIIRYSSGGGGNVG